MTAFSVPKDHTLLDAHDTVVLAVLCTVAYVKPLGGLFRGAGRRPRFPFRRGWYSSP